MQLYAVAIGDFVEILNAHVRWYNEKRVKLSRGDLSSNE